ncbi:hypothetical protein [Noviherbaspirillum cavernae]|nr:hypothetical protein [Noviherbaspirillum cavernae]
MSNDVEMEEAKYSRVPADFPRPVHFGAVPGMQPKLLATKYNGRFYSPGCSPPELFERWDICEDLANQLATKSLESKAGKRAHMTEAQILDQYLPRLIETKWTSEPEARWVIRRTAEIIGWPVPASATESSE